MVILQVKDLAKDWNGETLFDHASFDVQEGDRKVLLGRNGAGKTTLLRCLTGELQPDRGRVRRMLPLREWGWLNQAASPGASCSVLDFVLSQSVELYGLKRELQRLQDLMRMEEKLEAALSRYGELQERYVQLGGYDWEWQAEQSLQRLGLGPDMRTLPFSRLSGGQRTRAQLAAMLMREPKFLILDEPTNHLDQSALQWLERWLAAYKGTVLMVSHDRTFIDRTATAVVELASGGCKVYPGGYAEYRDQKELELRTMEALIRRQELERQKLLESIRRYAEWFQQSHKAAGQNDFYRSKAKKNVSRLHAKEAALGRLERERIRKPADDRRLNLRLEAEGREIPVLLRMSGIAFGYGEQEAAGLFRELNLTVQRGDRIAVIGPNGAGKTTLLKLAMGLLAPKCGTVQAHPQTRFGYFAQVLDGLETEETLLNVLLDLPGMTQTEARTILGCFLFSEDAVHKRIGDLSMGEKCRAAFLKLYFGRANLLVLDEPTNYLDIDAKEIVEEALARYPGAMLLVTHDRYLIRRAANKLLILDGEGNADWFPGTYEAYLERPRERTLTALEQADENERELISLRLARLMALPEPEDEEERERLTAKIIALRRTLDGRGG